MSTGVKLPSDAKDRKKVPIYSGVLKYFPDAIAEIAKVSWAGNEQHNPGEPLHWAREKSTDQEDTMTRHLMESGTIDTDGQRHSAKMAWRALAILQLEIEAERKKKQSSLPNGIAGDITGGTIELGAIGGYTPTYSNVPNNQPGIKGLYPGCK